MRLAALVALVLAAASLSGCTEAASRLKGADPPPEPYYVEHREMVAPDHRSEHRVPVGAGARLLNATLTLDTRTNGLPLGEPASPAQLTLELLDPAGALLQAVKADAQRPTATLLVEAPAAEGEYVVRVVGRGASGALDGQDYGARYLLSIEVAYA